MSSSLEKSWRLHRAKPARPTGRRSRASLGSFMLASAPRWLCVKLVEPNGFEPLT